MLDGSASSRSARSRRRGPASVDGRRSGVVERLLADGARGAARPTRRRCPDELVAAVAPAGRLRAALDRARRVPGRAAPGVSRSSSASAASTTTTTSDAIEKLDEFVRARAADPRRLRRQRPPADARRQGRLPLRRLRVAVRARGRRGARLRRGARAARRSSRSTAARDIQIGITHGRLRSGTYGHDERRTFVCLGDAVNLAARLMSRRRRGEIYVSELVRRARGRRASPGTKLEPLAAQGQGGARSRPSR